MRFSVLTLLIVLPAAAYAAVCPQQLSIQSVCGERGDSCDPKHPCCGRFLCTWNGFFYVCAIAYFPSIL
ncbi:hypothetical protein BGW80DRAFT_1319512 [Lactifluus volemus]|nr:hypothetical protein BGW80DRAFT_1319512 [Lactifluus volemus]